MEWKRLKQSNKINRTRLNGIEMEFNVSSGWEFTSCKRIGETTSLRWEPDSNYSIFKKKKREKKINTFFFVILASGIQIFLFFLFSNFISIVFLLPFLFISFVVFFYFFYFFASAFFIEWIIISATLIFDMIIVQFLPIFQSVC